MKTRLRLSTLVVAPVAVLALIYLIGLSTGCGGGTRAPAAHTIGTLQIVHAPVTVLRDGRTTDVSTASGFELAFGDTISTGTGARAVVRAGAQVHVLEENASLRLAPPDTASGETELTRVDLMSGVASFFLPPPPRTRRFQAVTHTVVATVRGTIFRVAITSDGVLVTVIRGQVELHDPSAAPQVPPLATLSANARALVQAGKAVPKPMSPDEILKLKDELLSEKEQLHLDIIQF